MWNYYTKEINNQGYNIEFDDKKLVESILRNNPILDGCNFAFGNIDYSKENDSEYSRIVKDAMLSSMEIAISKLFLTVAKDVIYLTRAFPSLYVLYSKSTFIINQIF